MMTVKTLTVIVVINSILFMALWQLLCSVFTLVKSPEYKLIGAKEIKALYKHTQTTCLVISCIEKCKDPADNLIWEVLVFQ